PATMPGMWNNFHANRRSQKHFWLIAMGTASTKRCGRSAMRQCARIIVVFSLLAILNRSAARAADQKFPFDGEWRTSFGIVTLKQTGNTVSGTYGDNNQFTLKGAAAGKKLSFEYQEGQATGDANWTLDQGGHSFTGGYQIRGGQGGVWEGWR